MRRPHLLSSLPHLQCSCGSGRERAMLRCSDHLHASPLPLCSHAVVWRPRHRVMARVMVSVMPAPSNPPAKWNSTCVGSTALPRHLFPRNPCPLGGDTPTLMALLTPIFAPERLDLVLSPWRSRNSVVGKLAMLPSRSGSRVCQTPGNKDTWDQGDGSDLSAWRALRVYWHHSIWRCTHSLTG